MVFSSEIFLFLFLPLVIGVYFVVPKKYRNLVLLFFSLLFYTWGEEKLVLLLILSSCIDFSCGILMDKGLKKLGLTISILTNLSLLAFFKYASFGLENALLVFELLGIQNVDRLLSISTVALPLGISFYTFQTMSYSIDVYRGDVKANRNFINFACYVTMFPQLVAGPIVRYIDINEQLLHRETSWGLFAEGIERFIIGLAKKVILANYFAVIADGIFEGNLAELSTFNIWLGIIAYSFQIYFDFSGYSDMAIGLGKMFGFTFLENFNYPYIAKNIRDFWRRWHISLSSWFRDYVYISLGGNRGSNLRTYFNLFIVFAVTGLWHGASWNFIFWGLFHGFFIILERLGLSNILKKLPVFLQHIYTLIVVVVGWLFFRIESLSEAFLLMKNMFWYTAGNNYRNAYLELLHFDKMTCVFIVIAVLVSLPLTIIENWSKKYKHIQLLCLAIMFVVSIVCIISGSYNPFIYFRF